MPCTARTARLPFAVGIFLALMFPAWSSTSARAENAPYNSDFLTDAGLARYDALSQPQIQQQLARFGSYFQRPVPDVDGMVFDAATEIAAAARAYRINPLIILATLEKENNALTTQERPPDYTLRFLTGCLTPSTARAQIACTAERLRAYDNQILRDGVTVSGWRPGQPTRTADGVLVTPANRAVAGQFTYTPYAGAQWGGNQPEVGGVFLLYRELSRLTPPILLPATRFSGGIPLEVLIDPVRYQMLFRKLG